MFRIRNKEISVDGRFGMNRCLVSYIRKEGDRRSWETRWARKQGYSSRRSRGTQMASRSRTLAARQPVSDGLRFCRRRSDVCVFTTAPKLRWWSVNPRSKQADNLIICTTISRLPRSLPDSRIKDYSYSIKTHLLPNNFTFNGLSVHDEITLGSKLKASVMRGKKFTGKTEKGYKILSMSQNITTRSLFNHRRSTAVFD